MRVFLLAVFPFVALSLTSCTPSTSGMDALDSKTPPAPLRQLNPAPRQGYRIRLTIQDAPGPLVLTDATAQYDVVNEVQCGKESPTGGLYRMVSNEPLVLTRRDDVTYEGVVYLDQILDGDYYGFGACKWKLMGVRAAFSATGKDKGETRFVPDLSSELIKEGGSETRYFWKGRYPRSGMGGFVSSGETDRHEIKDELQDELFTMDLSAREVQP